MEIMQAEKNDAGQEKIFVSLIRRRFALRSLRTLNEREVIHPDEQIPVVPILNH